MTEGQEKEGGLYAGLSLVDSTVNTLKMNTELSYYRAIFRNTEKKRRGTAAYRCYSQGPTAKVRPRGPFGANRLVLSDFHMSRDMDPMF